ncbi:lantibiotic dehydratase [Colwelliaceae bacterium MEBiC 14330]
MIKNKIKPQNFFVIRTPRFPISSLLSLGTDYETSVEQLHTHCKKPEFLEAIFLASPSLHARIVDFLIKNQTTDKKIASKLYKTVIKYIIRMSSRPTPFGLFSGICLGEITEKTKLISNNPGHDCRKTRLDMFYLNGLKDYYSQTNAQSSLLKYTVNQSIYNIGDEYRYIEAYRSKNSQEYRLSAIEVDDYSQFIVEQATKAKSFEQLSSLFQKKFQDIDIEEINAYLLALIDEKVLIANLSMPITGKPAATALIESLTKIKELEVVDKLTTTLDRLNHLDNNKVNTANNYKEIVNQLKSLAVEVDESRLFQTDVSRSFSHCQLSEHEVNALLNKIVLIHSLSQTPKSRFTDFKNSFYSRYEGQLVPLMELLDEESGISFSLETGYEAPLIAGLDLANTDQSNEQYRQVSTLDTLITRAISLPENRNSAVITLNSKTLKAHINHSEPQQPLPASFAAILSLYEEPSNQGHNNKNTIIKLDGCYGPSAANILGRFCHLDEGLQAKVVEQLDQEANHSKEVIFAEIAYSPEGRPGNVIARPHLRPYEIVLLADSSLSSEYQIPLSDLYVCVQANTIKLWSKRLAKRVIPRLSSAHNTHSNSLSIYKFLSLLQLEEGMPISYRNPESQKQASFVPRIMLDNVILSEKIWRIPREELVPLINQGQLNRKALRALQKKYKLDNQVTLSLGDNVLTLNLNNSIMFDILLQETKQQTIVELKESLITQYNSAVTSAANQQYANEIIVPFFNDSANVQQNMTSAPKAHEIKRQFSPGSEWLSLKIYAGNTTLESLLIEHIEPFIQQNEDLFHRWFFIRYSDPDWHLRIRFNGVTENLYRYLLPKLNQLFEPMISSGVLHKLELFTYNREVERYGGQELISVAEDLFNADSNLIIKTLKFTESGEDMSLLRMSLLMIDTLLTQIGLSETQKINLISRLRTAFGQEFNESGTLRKQLGQKYASFHEQVNEDLITYQGINLKALDSISTMERHSNSLNKNTLTLFNLLHVWQQEVNISLQAIKNRLIQELSTDNITLNSRLGSLLSSLLHMHINRMFKAYGREHELLIYDVLRRYYISLAHKKV